MSRPPLSPTRRRAAVVPVSFTHDEKALLAEHCGDKPLSTWIRERMLAICRPQRYGPEPELRAEDREWLRRLAVALRNDAQFTEDERDELAETLDRIAGIGRSGLEAKRRQGVHEATVARIQSGRS